MGSNNSSSSTGENFNVNKEYVYGMTDLSPQEDGTNYQYTHKLFKSLGVTSVRLWMHCNWMMKSPTEYSESGLAKLRSIYNDIKGEGYQIIAMNHSNFHKSGMLNSASTTAKPERDLTEGSYYLSWLNDIETTYYNMVMAFPDIQYWEIDNECNNDDFMPKLGGGSFSLQEKAEIYYDMMYFASKGIHRANPNAVTIMGGLIVSNAETFLNYIYDLIYRDDSWSKNPDDYFQAACWHPYMSIFTKNKFITLNNDIYEVVKQREGKDKKVFLTEMGFTEANGNSPEDTATYIKQMYEACRDDLYYVESMHYFRMYDDYSTTWGSEGEKYFGLFYDPEEKKTIDGVAVKDMAEPKPGAYAFQEVSGGEGSLDIYRDFLKGNYETKIVMHRGYSNKARENTIESFTLAAEQDSVYGIETDVYLTSDNKPILIHDADTNRVTYGKTNISVPNSTLETLRNIRLPDIQGNPDVHQIPVLSEYLNILKTYQKVGFLELKEDFSNDELKIIFDEIEDAGLINQIVPISFYKGALEKVRVMYPEMEIMFLGTYNDMNIDYLKEHNFGADIDYNSATIEEIQYLQSQGIKINVWTVDDKEKAHTFGRLGVDYLTTDNIVDFKD